MNPDEIKVHGTRANMSNVLKTDMEQIKSDFETALSTAVQTIQQSMNDNLRPINDTLARLDININNNSVEIEEQGRAILTLKAENSRLQQAIDDLTSRIGNIEIKSAQQVHQPNEMNTKLTEEIEKVKERVEERTNRQLRQTLVIKGVPEQPKETWEQTKQLLAHTIAENVQTTYTSAYQLLNRVHRSAPSDNPNKRGQRDIYANIYSWDHCTRLVDDFRHLNVRGQSNIHVEFKYGPLTTNRRIQAMGRRKELKAAGHIISGYVAYPARLMVKATGTTTYRMIEDFSLAPFKDFKPTSTVSSVTVELDNTETVQQSGWTNSDLSTQLD